MHNQNYDDKNIFDETYNEVEELEEDAIIQGLDSTDDMEETLDLKENDNLRPEDYGIKTNGKSKNIYCDKQELYEEIRKYQKDNNPTDALGEMLIKIALHMSTMSRFWRYSHAIKEEIVNHAIMQMLISVPKFNLKDKKKNPFGYLSMICYRDMLHSLKRHFKQDKVRDALSKAYIGKLSVHNPSDERLAALRQTLERNEEYNNFMKNDKSGQRQTKEVDAFALSRKDQKKRARKSRKSTK